MWIWAVPAGILIIAALPVLMLLVRATAEARDLTARLRGFGELRPAMVELRRDVQAARAAVARLRNQS